MRSQNLYVWILRLIYIYIYVHSHVNSELSLALWFIYMISHNMLSVLSLVNSYSKSLEYVHVVYAYVLHYWNSVYTYVLHQWYSVMPRIQSRRSKLVLLFIICVLVPHVVWIANLFNK